MKSCEVLGTKKMVGRNVSHANNKTIREFLPNLREYEFKSDLLGSKVSVLLSQKGRKTIEKYGGFDDFLLVAKKRKLSTQLLKLKKIVSSKKVI